LLANYEDVPNNLIRAVVDSNATRKEFIANQIIQEEPEIVGIHRLTMKTDSDNFRQAAIFDIMKKIRSEGIEVVIYEPSIEEDEFEKYRVVKDLDTFLKESDVILANRMDEVLEEYADKVYTRDLYNIN